MVIGIDEVGRGCWAGPVVAAAVGFSSRLPAGLNDSKKLTAKRREVLDIDVRNYTTYVGLGWVWPREINELGLTKSVKLAMERAYDDLPGHTTETEVIIDGNINYLKDVKTSRALVRADGSVSEVSAASIVAKVARDNYMQEIALNYPQYGFDSHVGYGTKQHIEALNQHGILPIHRLNYRPIQKIIQQRRV